MCGAAGDVLSMDAVSFCRVVLAHHLRGDLVDKQMWWREAAVQREMTSVQNAWHKELQEQDTSDGLPSGSNDDDDSGSDDGDERRTRFRGLQHNIGCK